jgi:hypothetical protein
LAIRTGIALKYALKSIALFVLLLQPSVASASDVEEHLILADSVYHGVLTEYGFVRSSTDHRWGNHGDTVVIPMALWAGRSFGDLSAWMARDDRSLSRYHHRGRTILEQLAPVTAEVLEETYQKHKHTDLGLAEHKGASVIGNYLIHHHLALRYARDAGAEKADDGLRRALSYEAMAQGYLTDAFSGSHILVPVPDRFSTLNRDNLRKAHDRYGSDGVYVINSRGDVWRTFGDNLLFWYGPSRQFVLEACKTSIREVFLSYFVAMQHEVVGRSVPAWLEGVADADTMRARVQEWSVPNDGAHYYVDQRMPSLTLLPMAVTATWSVQSSDVDAHGIRKRFHYPQLRDAGLHDPDLRGVDKDFLYSEDVVPAWLIPSQLRDNEPRKLIRNDPSIASVRFIQERHFPPSYAGLLTSVGGGVAFGEEKDGLATSIGLGYGMLNDFFFLNKLSADVVFNPNFAEDRRMLLSSTFRAGIALPLRIPYDVIQATRVELGYAWGLRSPFKDHGVKLALGLESPTIPLLFTYSGITLRLKHQWLFFDEGISAVLFEIVLH